jgi:hypothetical protein
MQPAAVNSTGLWWVFWTVAFAAAGLGFALIALVVAVRGVADMKSLIRALSGKRH